MFAIVAAVRDLRNALVRSVAGLEVHVRGPVVGQVLTEGACRAVRDLRDVCFGDVGRESILPTLSEVTGVRQATYTTDDLMALVNDGANLPEYGYLVNVRGWIDSGVDQAVIV